MNDTLRHTIDTELGATQRNADELVMHRTSCKLKSPRTPLAMIAAQQLEASYLVACSTCQPSQRQMTELQAYVADRVTLEVERLVAAIDPCAADVTVIGRELSDDEIDARVIAQQTRAIVELNAREDLSDQQRKLLQLRVEPSPLTDAQRKRVHHDSSPSDEIDAFLAVAPKRVREIAQGADVVPLTKRGKHNVRRNARHDQRDVQPRAAAAPTGETKTCVDCQKDVKLTSFPTSTKGGQIVRLDYCRPCRSIRAAAKGK